MSDLHIDSNNFGEDELETLITLFQQHNIQHLHIAGDIANGFGETSQKFLAQLQCQLPVTFSLGNHDMLGLSEEAMSISKTSIHPKEHITPVLSLCPP